MKLHLITLAALLTFLFSSLPSLAQESPRYKLEVGQEIQYESVGDYRSLRSTATDHEEISQTWWVVRQNDDGSWRVVECNVRKARQISEGHQPQTSQSQYLVFCDVFPDGRVVPKSARLDFLRLPRDRAQKTWRAEYPGGRTDFTMLPAQSSADEIAFSYEDHSQEDEIDAVTRAGTAYFDPERGLIVSATGEFSEGDSLPEKGTTSTRLKSVEMKPPAFTGQLGREAQIYSQAIEKYAQAQTRAQRDYARGEAIVIKAGEELRATRSQLTLPMFTTELDKMLSKHDRVVKFFKQEAQHVAGLIGKPATEWTLKDLAGRSHALADYRGKVVLMDFWYRGCGYCVEAMPELAKVSDDFKNEPFVILGMNSDEDEKDARFVADKMHLNYATTLHGPKIPDKYGVHAFPTFILIDRAGIARDVTDGYSPHLREELDQAVRKLLVAEIGEGSN